MLLTARRAVLASIASVVVLAGCVGDESPKFKAIENLDVVAYLPPGVEVASDRANKGERIGTQQTPVYRTIDVDLPTSMSIADFRSSVVDRLEADGWELVADARTSEVTATTLGRKTLNGYEVSFAISTLHQPPDVTISLDVQ